MSLDKGCGSEGWPDGQYSHRAPQSGVGKGVCFSPVFRRGIQGQTLECVHPEGKGSGLNRKSGRGPPTVGGVFRVEASGQCSMVRTVHDMGEKTATSNDNGIETGGEPRGRLQAQRLPLAPPSICFFGSQREKRMGVLSLWDGSGD